MVDGRRIALALLAGIVVGVLVGFGAGTVSNMTGVNLGWLAGMSGALATGVTYVVYRASAKKPD